MASPGSQTEVSSVDLNAIPPPGPPSGRFDNSPLACSPEVPREVSIDRCTRCIDPHGPFMVILKLLVVILAVSSHVALIAVAFTRASRGPAFWVPLVLVAMSFVNYCSVFYDWVSARKCPLIEAISCLVAAAGGTLSLFAVRAWDTSGRPGTEAAVTAAYWALCGIICVALSCVAYKERILYPPTRPPLRGEAGD